MCVLGVRSIVKTQEVSEVEAAIGKAMSARAGAQPEGVRHTTGTADNGATFEVPGPVNEEEPRKMASA